MTHGGKYCKDVFGVFGERESCRPLEGADDSLRRRPVGKREKKNGFIEELRRRR